MPLLCCFGPSEKGKGAPINPILQDSMLTARARDETPGHSGSILTWTPKVCNIMAFWAVFNPRTPIFQVKAPPNHTLHGIWYGDPQISGTWTLRAIVRSPIPKRATVLDTINRSQSDIGNYFVTPLTYGFRGQTQ